MSKPPSIPGGPKPPVELLLAQSRRAEQQGSLLDAASLAEAATRIYPRNAEALHQAGRLVGLVGRSSAAIGLMRRALALRPRAAAWHRDLGGLLGRHGDFAQSVRSYRRAAELDPNDPLSLTGLANAHFMLREYAQARQTVERALKLGPQALFLSARLDIREGQLDGAEASLKQAIEHAGTDAQRSLGWHLLGSISESRLEWDQAFERHMKGNGISRQSRETRSALLPGGRTDRIPAYLGPRAEELYRKWASRPIDDGLPEPAFVVGFPRSGTTLVEQILAAHPDVHTTDEQNYTESMYHRLVGMIGTFDDASFLGRVDALSNSQIGELRSAYWADLRREQGEGARRKVVVDKNPLEILDVCLIARVFPGSRIVVVIRDPRDACVSALFQPFDIDPGTARMLELEQTGRFYREVMAFWIRARDLIGNPRLEFRYEALAANFEREARRLIEFLGLAWHDDVDRFHEKAAVRAVGSASFESVTRKVNTEAIGKWTRYEKHLGPLIDQVRPIMEAFGYV